MKSPADLKTLTNLIKFLQKQGCIVSASGLLALPFKFTKKNLSVDHKALDDVMDEFTFVISVMNVTLGKPFWSGDGNNDAYTVRQLAQGILK